jgi:hypothetical protein
MERFRVSGRLPAAAYCLAAVACCLAGRRRAGRHRAVGVGAAGGTGRGALDDGGAFGRGARHGMCTCVDCKRRPGVGPSAPPGSDATLVAICTSDVQITTNIEIALTHGSEQSSDDHGSWVEGRALEGHADSTSGGRPSTGTGVARHVGWGWRRHVELGRTVLAVSPLMLGFVVGGSSGCRWVVDDFKGGSGGVKAVVLEAATMLRRALTATISVLWPLPVDRSKVIVTRRPPPSRWRPAGLGSHRTGISRAGSGGSSRSVTAWEA